MRVDVFVDDERAPRASFEPPGELELDTSDLEDGPHVLRVRAAEGEGSAGNEEIPFVVRNGPGIAVVGLRKQEVVRGRVPILVNAYESRLGEVFAPGRAETPAPVPTWTWVLALVVLTWAMWYVASEYRGHADTLAAAAPGASAPVSAPASAAPATGAPAGALGCRAPVEGPRALRSSGITARRATSSPDRVFPVSFPRSLGAPP